MARASWIDDDDHPSLAAHVERLAHFTQSLADGVVDSGELATQEQNLIAAMKAVESELSDTQHAKVTALLAEAVAYTMMQVLHDMTQARVRQAIK
jgi:hypothetical protein